MLDYKTAPCIWLIKLLCPSIYLSLEIPFQTFRFVNFGCDSSSVTNFLCFTMLGGPCITPCATIVVEIFTNAETIEDNFVYGACTAIRDAIQCHILCPRNLNNIRSENVLKFVTQCHILSFVIFQNPLSTIKLLQDVHIR